MILDTEKQFQCMERLQCTGGPLKLRKVGSLCHVQLCPNPTCACSSWLFPRLASSPRPPPASPASPPRGCPSQMVREENRFGRSVMLVLLWQTNLYLGSLPSCKAALCGLFNVLCPSALQNRRLRSLRPLRTWDLATKEGRGEPWEG